jgi:hypothetical protein
MNSKQIDNSHLDSKVSMREALTKNGDMILDCFHGQGMIWNKIKSLKQIKVIGIEKEKGKGTGAIYGLAEKVIPSLDLSKFAIIDCDSYGIPFKAVKAIFNNKTLKNGTIIFYTLITTGMGSVDREMLEHIGITKGMYQKCHPLFRRYGYEAFKAYLFRNGIKKVINMPINEGPSIKNYGYFVV